MNATPPWMSAPEFRWSIASDECGGVDDLTFDVALTFDIAEYAWREARREVHAYIEKLILDAALS